MAKFKRTQLITLSLIATLFSLTPFLSSSLRSTYLYFITNLLIITLGAQAGFLSPNPSSSSPSSSTKTNPELDPKTPNSSTIIPPQTCSNSEASKAVEKSTLSRKIKKCPSSPSIFFIGSNEHDEEEHYYEGEEDHEAQCEKEGEELFAKAEVFIGNFYKQLKMQREESWNRIHAFYQNRFN